MTARPATTREAGFSLMELMVALTILALAMSVVSMALIRPNPGMELRRTASDVTSLFREARIRAQEENRMVRVAFLPEERRFEIAGDEALILPERIEASLLSSAAAGPSAVLFLPDGSSTGGRVTLTGAGVSEDVTVDWLTSRIERSRTP
ncbi:GspH/FimT family pseudopilin [Hyphomonas sp.]|uniref:GspH/FimT family pseudopilin n=1 Tax=Hyphomonas sp. TaxID=87 RepID=UPI00391B8E8F